MGKSGRGCARVGKKANARIRDGWTGPIGHSKAVLNSRSPAAQPSRPAAPGKIAGNMVPRMVRWRFMIFRGQELRHHHARSAFVKSPRSQGVS